MTSTKRILAQEVTGVIVAGHCMPARIMLRYDPVDAYAITLELKTKPRHAEPTPDRWLLSRELLAQGLTRATGEGNARIRPVSPDWILLDLATDHQPILMIMATPDACHFLDRSYDLVPDGTEAETIDWDALPRPVGS